MLLLKVYVGFHGPRVDDHAHDPFFFGGGWWQSEGVGESLLWGCSGAAVFPEGSFCVGFLVLFCLSFR
jgi:hypothetical protein